MSSDNKQKFQRKCPKLSLVIKSPKKNPVRERSGQIELTWLLSQHCLNMFWKVSLIDFRSQAIDLTDEVLKPGKLLLHIVCKIISDL